MEGYYCDLRNIPGDHTSNLPKTPFYEGPDIQAFSQIRAICRSILSDLDPRTGRVDSGSRSVSRPL